MVITGPRGVVIDRASGSKEAIYATVENGQTTAITKGSLCAWDTTANIAVAGILQDTFGQRVVVYPTAEAGDVADGKNRKAGFADIAMDGTAAGTRGKNYLIQVWGYRDDVQANTDAASNIIVGGTIQPSGDAAGTVEGPQTEGTITLDGIMKAVGMAFEVTAVNTTVAIKAMVNCF